MYAEDANEKSKISILLGSRFLLEDRIGGGSFGKVYRGKDRETKEAVAIKVERRHCGSNTLAREIKVLNECAEGFGFAKLLHYAKEDRTHIMVMTLLGQDLEHFFRLCNYHFSVNTILMLADQMISRVEFLHYRGYLHRDIKPENFTMGLGKTARNLFLIDFGLSKPWRDAGGRHIPYNEDRGMVGTARYASVNSHLGVETSRRDDLESVGYVLLYLLKGRLPWQSIRCDNASDKFSKIGDYKRTITPQELCKDAPRIFIDYFNHVKRLDFSSEPDYKYLKKLFRTYCLEAKYDFDYNYDWVNNQKLIDDGLQNQAGGGRKPNHIRNEKRGQTSKKVLESSSPNKGPGDVGNKDKDNHKILLNGHINSMSGLESSHFRPEESKMNHRPSKHKPGPKHNHNLPLNTETDHKFEGITHLAINMVSGIRSSADIGEGKKNNYKINILEPTNLNISMIKGSMEESVATSKIIQMWSNPESDQDDKPGVATPQLGESSSNLHSNKAGGCTQTNVTKPQIIIHSPHKGGKQALLPKTPVVNQPEHLDDHPISVSPTEIDYETSNNVADMYAALEKYNIM